MRRIIKRLLLALAVVVVVAQFIPAERTNPPVESELQAPPAVQAILRRACYDCHSNQTSWPWYSYVAPASWLVTHDVSEGRDHLNFSSWGRLRPRRRAQLVTAIWDEVEAGRMPLRQYLLAHPAARLDGEDRRILREWTQSDDGESESSSREQ
jgi:hypothetical protein